MNEKLKAFLDKKREEEAIRLAKEAEAEKANRNAVLIELGLFEKEYAPSEQPYATEEYGCFEYDAENQKNLYYKKVPIEISDEEFNEIKGYSLLASGMSRRAPESIPETLDECYAPDKVSEDLWNWSDHIKTIGQWVVGILVVIGIFATISSGIEMAAIDDDLIAIPVISSIISWTLYILVAVATFKIISLLVSSRAMLVQNTKISAKVALYKASKKEKDID